jgi:hypothetical protein
MHTIPLAPKEGSESTHDGCVQGHVAVGVRTLHAWACVAILYRHSIQVYGVRDVCYFRVLGSGGSRCSMWAGCEGRRASSPASSTVERCGRYQPQLTENASA